MLVLGFARHLSFSRRRTTEVEIAYQSLNREIAFQQNPNKDKDMGNPL